MSERLARICAALTAVAALLALAGWAFDVEFLRALPPGRVPMNPATALGLACAAGALALISRGKRRGMATTLTVLVVTFGLLKLGSSVFRIETGFDRFLFSQRLEAAPDPYGMAPNAAFCLTLFGSSLCLFARRRLTTLAQILAVAGGFLAFFAILAYVYDLANLYRVSAYVPMAPNAALAFTALSLGALALRPREGIASVFTSRGAGGLLARRLLPAAIGVPAILGAARLGGVRAGLYGTGEGLLLMVVMTVLLMTVMVWWTAQTLDRADRDRLAAQQTTAESSLFFESIFENLPLMVFVKDAHDLRFVKFNRAGEELVGFDRKDLLGRNDYDFFPPEQAEFFIAKDREVLAGTEPVDIPEEPIRTAAQGTRLLHTRKVPLTGPDGRPRYLLGISEDITERKRTEERVRQLNRELEAFSYSVSHDLRAPLRGIVGFSQALLEGHGERLDHDGRSLLGRIIAAGHRMGRLIDDLLTFSRLGRGEISRRHVDLTALAREIERGLKEAEPEREVEVVIADGLSGRGDPHLVRSVIENLLNNAWKYTGKGAGTRIEIGAVSPANGGPATFFVKDDGIGFDMAYADNLFAPFQRLHSSSEFDGTGIGLATVQRIVERHGGRVWAESTPGEGATFYFTLEEDDQWKTS
ncbi:MAG: ATP-binding protein [Gemmatimonadota bacterium]